MWRRNARSGVLVGIALVSLYFLLPSVLAVFASWRSLSHLDWPFAVLVIVCEAASFVCLWELDRIALHVRAWFPVATAQLSGNAVGRIVPRSCEFAPPAEKPGYSGWWVLRIPSDCAPATLARSW